MFFLIFCVAYCIGSIPFSFLVAKWFGLDLRTQGSKNIGATNVFRVVGRQAALLALLLDLGKGLVSAWIIQSYYGDRWITLITALGVVLGHMHSVFLKGKGGKGVATSVGVLIVIAPKSLLIVLTLWILILLVTRFVSIASIIAALFLPLTGCFTQIPKTDVVFFVLLTTLVIYRHKENILRLIHKNEPSIRMNTWRSIQ